MSLFMVDIESDGPAAGLHSMVCFGAVKVDRQLDQRFKGFCAPISKIYIPEALAVSGYTREQHEAFAQPSETMHNFVAWLRERNEGKMVLVSDNPAFDWSFINYYCHAFCGENPFGHSARRVGDFCAGLKGRWEATRDYRDLATTPHTHDPIDDAVGHAEGFIALSDIHGVKLPGVSSLGKNLGSKLNK
jgi:hypothetical protein